MAPKAISIPIQIRFADMDMAQHAHNAVYLHWFEQARMALLSTFLPADHDWVSTGILVARNEVDHRSPVKLSDLIEVECWCSSIGKKSFDLRYRVVRSGERSGICAEGRSVLVCFDLQQNRTIEVPEDWRAALEKLGRKDDDEASSTPYGT